MEITDTRRFHREGLGRFHTGDAFFNPLQEFQRDIGVLAARVHAQPLQHVSVVDCCAGCGIRAIRYKLELPADKHVAVLACDSSVQACAATRENLQLSGGLDVEVVCDDSKRLLASLAKKFDVVEIDPCGSIAQFLPAAAMCEDALLVLNSTDSKVLLSGTQPQVFFASYGVYPEDVLDRQELAIRVILGRLAMEAAAQNRLIIPKLCYGTDFNVRVIARVASAVSHSDLTTNTLGYAVSRDGVTRLVSADAGVELSESSVVCGPLWVGQLGDIAFIQAMQEQLRQSRQFQHHDRIHSVLDECRKNAQISSKSDCMQFIDVRVLKQRVGGAKLSMWTIVDRIRDAGHLAFSRTSSAHTNWLVTDMQMNELATLLSRSTNDQQPSKKSQSQQFRPVNDKLLADDDEIRHEHPRPAKCCQLQTPTLHLNNCTDDDSLHSILAAAFPGQQPIRPDQLAVVQVGDESLLADDAPSDGVLCIIVHGTFHLQKPFPVRGRVAFIGVKNDEEKAAIWCDVPCGWKVERGGLLFIQDLDVVSSPAAHQEPQTRSTVAPKTKRKPHASPLPPPRDHCFHVEGGQLTMLRCTVASRAVGVGVFGGSCTLNHCNIQSELSSGVYVSSKSSVHLQNTVIHHCAAAGVSASNGSSLSANDCEFNDNGASGVYARSSRLVFENCRFDRNSRCGLECFTSCDACLCSCHAHSNACSAVLCADSSLHMCSSEVRANGMANIDVRGASAKAEIFNTSICDGKRSAIFVSSGAHANVDHCELRRNRRLIEVSRATATRVVVAGEAAVPPQPEAETEQQQRSEMENSSSSPKCKKRKKDCAA